MSRLLGGDYLLGVHRGLSATDREDMARLGLPVDWVPAHRALAGKAPGALAITKDQDHLILQRYGEPL